MKRSRVAGLLAMTGLSFVVLWFYLTQVSRAPENSAEIAVSPMSGQQCTLDKSKALSVAYRVHAEVKSELNKNVVYRSTLNFKTQLQQATGNRVFGKADSIQIVETLAGQAEGQSRPIDDVLYLTKKEQDSHLAFTYFDYLGLAAKHPMSILSQLIKNLSVGENGKTYYFSYDQLKRQYRYHADVDKPFSVERELLSEAADSWQNRWHIQLGSDCLPLSMTAEEVLPIGSGNNSGYVSFSMSAERIPDYTNLLKIAYSPNANEHNRWQAAVVNGTELAEPVSRESQMWQLLDAFAQNRNAAELVRAVDFMIDNVPVEETAQTIIDNSLDDATVRDTIFGMSMSDNPMAESYMLNLLTALRTNSEASLELNKLRLMVAISSNAQVSDIAFQTFSQLRHDNNASVNFRNTALINQGTMIQQMANQFKDTSAQSQALSAGILDEMDGENAYAAIFSAGNAGLERLGNKVEQAVKGKLTSADTRERYASASVLVGDASNYSQLIEHLATETSSLVAGAIVSGLKVERLSGAQRAQLQTIAAGAPQQLQEQINKLLGS